MVGVALDEDGWKSVRLFVKEKNIRYPIVVGNDDTAKQYGVESLPMTFLIDRNGRIAATYSGMVDKDKCEREIRELLAATRRR